MGYFSFNVCLTLQKRGRTRGSNSYDFNFCDASVISLVQLVRGSNEAVNKVSTRF